MAVHTIRPGDTLGSLARRYNTSVDALAKANNLQDPNRIIAGQSLTIPDGFDAPRASPATTRGGQSYTVKSGDTLSGIASRFGTSVGAIAQANGISNPNLIQVGQRLTIPGGSAPSAPPPTPAPSQGAQSYTVKPGDTLSGIASRYGTSVGAIAQANGISNPNLIQVGQRLTIPGGSGPSAPPPTPAPSQGSQSYTVQPGDTLSGIASRYGTSVGAIAQANGISNPNLIQVGQRLTIPGGSAPQPGPVSGPGPVTGPGGGTSGGVSLQQLRAIMPNLSQDKAAQYLPYLNSAMAEAGINTPRRQAAFLAQLAHESGQFRYMEEIASGAAYEGRADLGNTQPGDGVRFKGRGPIQLTGRNNYRAAGRALGIDLENNPTRAADPDVGFRTAAWFWNSRNLNSYADAGNFDAITYRVNGGYNGKASRDAYYARALQVLGA